MCVRVYYLFCVSVIRDVNEFVRLLFYRTIFLFIISSLIHSLNCEYIHFLLSLSLAIILQVNQLNFIRLLSNNIQKDAVRVLAYLAFCNNCFGYSFIIYFSCSFSIQYTVHCDIEHRLGGENHNSSTHSIPIQTVHIQLTHTPTDTHIIINPMRLVNARIFTVLNTLSLAYQIIKTRISYSSGWPTLVRVRVQAINHLVLSTPVIFILICFVVVFIQLIWMEMLISEYQHSRYSNITCERNPNAPVITKKKSPASWNAK